MIYLATLLLGINGVPHLDYPQLQERQMAVFTDSFGRGYGGPPLNSSWGNR